MTKKIKVIASVCMGKEVELEVPENYTYHDIENAFHEQHSLPEGVYPYATDDPEDWIADCIEFTDENGSLI